MSGAEPGEKEKKAKPPLVRLGQNGAGARKSPLFSLGSPRGSPSVPGITPSPLATPKSGGQMFSFRSKRDLTLGAKPSPNPIPKPLERKKFVPNLNVQRLVKKESDEPAKSTEGKGGKRRKENKHERREKNSRDRPTLIQTGSIFSEGIGGDAVIRRRAAGYSSRDDSSDTALVRPKLELSQSCTREDEEEKLKNLLRDDFIDDLKGGNFVPVQLPMIDTGKMFKPEVKKTEASEDDIRPKILNKKVSELDSDDDEEDDPAKVETRPAPVIQEQPTQDPTVQQLLKLQAGQLVFIQLPDTLPLAGEASNVSCLDQLEGRLGRLQIRKSGRCQMILGDEKLDVETGTKVGFLQDAVSVRVPENPGEEGELTVLGHVTHRLVLAPDWDSLLQKSGLNQSLA